MPLRIISIRAGELPAFFVVLWDPIEMDITTGRYLIGQN
jgi:hypothetical protein